MDIYLDACEEAKLFLSHYYLVKYQLTNDYDFKLLSDLVKVEENVDLMNQLDAALEELNKIRVIIGEGNCEVFR